jgi:hypothetical protein
MEKTFETGFLGCEEYPSGMKMYATISFENLTRNVLTDWRHILRTVEFIIIAIRTPSSIADICRIQTDATIGKSIRRVSFRLGF